MSDPLPSPRPVDHCVLPVADLHTARSRLTSLGFTVAPDGVHPFGTANCCVYLADGTFLEPLAVADMETATEDARLGNVFVKRDAAYRYRMGENGFSAVAFGTGDAETDHASFVEHGLSAGGILKFWRDFIYASERRAVTASFMLAFAADLRAPDCFFFTCQRVNTPKIEKGELQEHANGVTRLKRIVLTAPDAAAFVELVRLVCNAASTGKVGGATEIVVANAIIELLDNDVMRTRFGVQASDDPGLRLRGIVFGVKDIGQAETRMKSEGVGFERRDAQLIVHPAPGQGAIFIFEAE
jgi:hypothetical protein